MTEIAVFVRDLGVPIASMVALGIVLYKIGTVCGTLLIEAWKAKDTRLSELETRVERINNGQREALENRLDVSIRQAVESTEALDKVGACLDRLGAAFANFAVSRPCLHDSDVTLIQLENGEEITPTPDGKTLAKIAKRKERQQGAGG